MSASVLDSKIEKKLDKQAVRVADFFLEADAISITWIC